MPNLYEIRADYDRTSIVIYQAYSRAIADAALAAGRFVEPFSFNRMTWIKPSFLWLMHRSGFGTKSLQERILAVRMTRDGFEKALSLAVLTDPKAEERWLLEQKQNEKNESKEPLVRVQWDPERSLQGALNYRSIQIGISRFLIREYVEKWIVEIKDYTEKAHKIQALLQKGETNRAKALLPAEAVYPVSIEIQKRLQMVP